ncbi:hypothetical protein CVO76_13455 [Arthrobacter agilis]|uniref:HNH nuclease domain-containing protein n=2 Tax=Arthrobacter agilis TaxID=37921 RepID=A0A2L0UH10_9MICC|nr:hypothetical protein CVO76_13455 [Arthrobacter agilis]
MAIDRHHRQYRTRRELIRKRWAREQRRCYLGGCYIDYEAPAGHPQSFELDHIVPIARGGALMDPDNWAASCRKCNRSKSDKDLDTYLGQAAAPQGRYPHPGITPIQRTTTWGDEPLRTSRKW